MSDEIEIQQFRDRFRGREGGPKWRAAVADKIIEATETMHGSRSEEIVESWLLYVESVAYERARRELTQT